MGLFDSLVVEYALPDVPDQADWQTKTFDCALETYKITADGKLIRERARYGDHEKIHLGWPVATSVGHQTSASIVGLLLFAVPVKQFEKLQNCQVAVGAKSNAYGPSTKPAA